MTDDQSKEDGGPWGPELVKMIARLRGVVYGLRQHLMLYPVTSVEPPEKPDPKVVAAADFIIEELNLETLLEETTFPYPSTNVGGA